MSSQKKSYLTEAKKLIQELEFPLAEVEEVLIKLRELNIPEDKRDLVLEKLKYLGEVFEPRKNKLKTL